MSSPNAGGVGDITRLASVSWTGSAGNNLWSSPANWAAGAIPDAANVAAVNIPAGSGGVVMDSVGVSIDSLTSARPVSQSASGSFVTSLVSPLLALDTQAGIALTSGANQISALRANNSGGGDIAITNGSVGSPVPLTLVSMNNTAGNIDVINFGALTTTGLVNASGGVTLTANSPLTIGTPGITAGGNIALNATNLTSAGNLTLNGPLSSGGAVNLAAASNLVQNSSVIAASGVTASAGGSMSFGPLATTSTPASYVANGVVVPPPPGSLGASEPIKEEIAKQVDLVVTFLDLFEKAVDAQQTDSADFKPDGSKKKKEETAIVTEGEVCR